jgi:hypothetical protein
MKVNFVDEYISEVIPENLGWNKNLSLKDKVKVVGINNNESKIERK